ncbi:chalcone isomerase-like protein 1 isoform X2 [Nicotiana tabacum]|uniref:Chalcone isomerase-like protein 1 isoform X2 n=1 Tax=Nicotiana tabacum TaxID=4097 RepID=A0AC58UAY5_TOBAC
MPSTMEDVTTKTEVEPKSANTETEKESSVCEKSEKEKKEKCDQVELIKEEEIPVETEPKTGVTFPVKLQDGKLLKAVGLRKKSMLGIGLKIYGFGIYADNEKMKELMQSKIGNKAPSKPTKEMYQMVIDSDFGMMVRLVIVFSGLSMSMVRKNFDEGLGAAIKKLTGGKNEDLTKKIMGEASDDIKLTSGSVIEISRLPGYVLQTKGTELEC